MPADLPSQPGAALPPSVLIRLRRVWPYFGRAYFAWFVAIAATVVASATEPLIPAMLKPLLDRGFTKGSLELWSVPAALLLLFGVRGLAGFLAQMALAKVTSDGLLALRRIMFDKLLDARLALFGQQSSSTLANTIVYEVFNGSAMLVNSLMSATRDSLTLLALVCYLLYLNWKLTLIVALLFPAIALVMKVLSRRLYRLTRASQQATDGLAYVVEENVLAHRDVRLHGAQAAQLGRFGQLSESLRRLSMKTTVASAAMTPITQMLAAVALSAVISVALLQSTSGGATVGGFVAFVTAMLMLVAPIKHLSEVASPITRGLAALERALDLIEGAPSESGGTHRSARAQGEIRFEQVSVVYAAEGRPAVDRLDLVIHPGETVALVGASGSGKTTLVSLLPRFIEPTGGRILLDGTPIEQWELASLRAQLAFVSQHVVMLNDTIAANVALGQALERDKVWRCLEAANLSELVAGLPQGLDTVVGHNATQLSGGQRQRLAIARALIVGPRLLVLDEPTSALDVTIQKQVLSLLQRLQREHGLSYLLITHDVDVIRAMAHEVMVMKDGLVVEAGPVRQVLQAPREAYTRTLVAAAQG